MHHIPAPTVECEPEWQSKPISALIAYISSTYHEHTRQQLPRLWQQAVELASRLGDDRSPHLGELAQLLTELRDHVDTHAWTEDDLLFPVLIARDHPAVLVTTLTPEGLTRLVDTLAEEHVVIRRVLARVTAHLRDTATMAGGVAAWAALHRGIEECRDRLIEELDLEDRCLLPRARELAASGLDQRRYR